MKRNVDIVIIGAGLTGLTAGYYLNKAGLKVLILEKSDRAGGVIETCREDGFVYERGPNAGVLTSPLTAQLFDELSDDCELELAPASLNRYVSKSGQWHALPKGPIKFIKSPLFSFRDKLGLMFEMFRPKGTDASESLASFVKRRLGSSILNYAVDPFILGVYAGDPAELSVKYAFPQMHEMEQEHGSLFKAMKAKKKAPQSFANYRRLFSFKDGMESLVHALKKRIGSDKFIFKTSETSVTPIKNGGFKVMTFLDGETLEIQVKKVIVACGAFALPKLLPFVPQHDLEDVASCPYTDVIEVTLGFKKWQGIPLNGFGGLCPHIESHKILGAIYTSTVMSNRAPEGGALLAIFIGGVRQAELVQKSDEELVKILGEELKPLMKLNDFKPDLVRIHRQYRAIPQYGPESKNRFQAIEKIEGQFPGLSLAGDFIGGIGLSKRIHHATKIATKLITKVKNN